MGQTLNNDRISTRQRGQPVIAKVLQITLEQLALHGYERLSVPEVALLAGLNKTSIYRRWPTKKLLVRDALRITTGGDLAIPDTGSFRSDFLVITRNAITFAESPLGKSVLRVLLSEGNNPEIREFASSMLHDQKSQDIGLIFKRAIARGQIKPSTDILFIFSIVSGALLQRIFVEQAPATDEFLEALVDLILVGLAK